MNYCIRPRKFNYKYIIKLIFNGFFKAMTCFIVPSHFVLSLKKVCQ